MQLLSSETSAPILEIDAAARQSRRQFSRGALVDFTAAMASLLEAGLPLGSAITTAGGSSSAPPDGIADILARVSRGTSLASAIAAQGRPFSAAYVGVVRAGERSGQVAQSFARLASQLEREQQLRARVVSATIYPTILAAAGGVSVLILLVFVLPRFAVMLVDSGAELPVSTRALLAFSSVMASYWVALLLATGVIVGGLVAFVRTTAGRRWWSQLLLGVPVARTLRRQAVTASASRLLGVLMEGGATLVSALEDTATSIDEPLAEDELLRIRGRVREGGAFSAALKEGKLFSPLLAQLVAVGETAGEVPRFLAKAADLMDERVDRLRHRFVTFIEPAMIFAFGGAIGFVALSLLQAVYGLNAGAIR